MKAARSHGTRLGMTAAAVVFLLLPGARIPAQGIVLNPLMDGIILGSSIGIAGLSELLMDVPRPMAVPAAPDIESIDFVDRAAMVPYAKQADTVSSILQYASIFMPFLWSVTRDPGSAIGESVVYAESLAMGYGAKNIFKYLFPRYRPYVYLGGAQGIDSSEDDQSFPSGHSTMAFTAAAFSAYLYFKGLPETASSFPFVILEYSLAGITAAYRVASGVHFVTDVIAGALLGTFCGFIAPSLLRMP